MEILASVIIAGVLAGIYAVFRLYRGAKKMNAMKGHRYVEIATKWHLWDEFVNCYYEDAGGNFVKPETPMKAKFLSYGVFSERSVEEKIKMLVAEFGEERENKSNQKA